MKKPVLSLQEVLELYLAEHEYENSSKATIQYYIWNIGRFIKFLIDEQHIENPKVTDFKAEYIIKYLMRLKKSKKWENRQDIKPEKRKGKIGSQSIKTYACFWQVENPAVRNLIFRAPLFHYWDFMVECISL